MICDHREERGSGEIKGIDCGSGDSRRIKVNYYDIVVELGGKQRRKSSCEEGGKREEVKKERGRERDKRVRREDRGKREQ